MLDNDGLRVRSVREAASLLGISKSTLDKLRCTGDGPRYVSLGTGKGARIGYRLPDLQVWLDSRVRKSTSDMGA